MSFSHDDVQRLIKLLDSSHFDELHLEAEGIKLTLRRNGAPSTAPATSSTAPAAAVSMTNAAAPPGRAAAAASGVRHRQQITFTTVAEAGAVASWQDPSHQG